MAVGFLIDASDGASDDSHASCFKDDVYHLPTEVACEALDGHGFERGSCHSSTGLQRLWPRRLGSRSAVAAARRCGWAPSADKVLLRVDRETSAFLRAQWLRDNLALDQETSAFLKCRLASVPERRRMSQAAPSPSVPKPTEVDEMPCAADDSCASRRGFLNPLPPPSFLA